MEPTFGSAPPDGLFYLQRPASCGPTAEEPATQSLTRARPPQSLTLGSLGGPRRCRLARRRCRLRSPRLRAALASLVPAPAPPAMAAPPRRSRSYHPACEAATHHQIHLELYVIYVYESMASYFEKNIALKYVSQFLRGQSALLKEHAEGLIRLQNQRSGQPRRYDGSLDWPDYNYWDSSLQALDHALGLAEHVNQNLLHLHQLATEKKDARLSDFLEDSTLINQVKSIEELRGHLSTFPMYPRNPEESLEEHLLDKLSLDDKKN